ncbi:MAG: fimbria major subunit, partial [Tannerellaceae bacterium]|nr:fimbria major subunit [Tannerellaceae bacterium]
GGAQIESPYYDAGAGFDWASIYARNTSPAFTSATAVATSSTPPPGGGKSYYITENTPQIPRNGSATYAAIKTTAIPTKGHYVSALSFSELNGGQFAGTKGSVDATQGVTFYVLDSLQVLTTTATGLSNGTVFAGSDAYNLARKAVYHLLNPTLPQLTTLGDYSTDQNVTAALTAAIWNKYIHVYNNGVAYYRLNIGSVVNGILKPEVKRNKFYQLNIDHYKVLGAATLAELLGDEDEEITSETYLTVKVTIDEWVPVTGGVDI